MILNRKVNNKIYLYYDELLRKHYISKEKYNHNENDYVIVHSDELWEYVLVDRKQKPIPNIPFNWFMIPSSVKTLKISSNNSLKEVFLPGFGYNKFELEIDYDTIQFPTVAIFNNTPLELKKNNYVFRKYNIKSNHILKTKDDSIWVTVWLELEDTNDINLISQWLESQPKIECSLRNYIITYKDQVYDIRKSNWKNLPLGESPVPYVVSYDELINGKF